MSRSELTSNETLKKHMTIDPELTFRIGNAVALLAGRILPLLFALVYGALLLSAEPTGGSFNSLAGVQQIFSSPHALTAGWLHYLAFDLFVGAWIAQRADTLQLPHWQVVPILALTFLFGPLGYAAFICLRAVRRPQSLRLHG